MTDQQSILSGLRVIDCGTYIAGPAAELYDHQTDPHEFTNLVHDPKYAKALAEMRKTLKEGWRSALPVASSTAVIETRNRPH